MPDAEAPTPQQVADAMLEYYRLGVGSFLIRGFDPFCGHGDIQRPCHGDICLDDCTSLFAQASLTDQRSIKLHLAERKLAKEPD